MAYIYDLMFDVSRCRAVEACAFVSTETAELHCEPILYKRFKFALAVLFVDSLTKTVDA